MGGNRGVEPFGPHMIHVGVGDHKWSSWDQNERWIPVSRVIVHPGYDDEVLANDIALLVLTRSIDEEVQSTIELPPTTGPLKESLYAVDAPITLIGWGADETDRLSETLQKLTYNVADRKECKEYYTTGEFEGLVWPEGIMCTGIKDKPNTKHAWGGDSGGPLFHTVEGKTYVLGLVSFGTWEPDPDAFGANTDVSYHVEWIKKVMLSIDHDSEEEEDKFPSGHREITLKGGFKENEGIVFVSHKDFKNPLPRPVCSDGFGHNEATMICRYLGYKHGKVVPSWMFGLGDWDMEGYGYTNVQCPQYQNEGDDFFGSCKNELYDPSKANILPCFEGDQAAVSCSKSVIEMRVERVEIKVRSINKGKGLKMNTRCSAVLEKYGQPVHGLGRMATASIVNIMANGTIERIDRKMKYKSNKGFFLGTFKTQMLEETESCLACVVYLDHADLGFGFKIDQEQCGYEPENAAELLKIWAGKNDEEENSDENDKETPNNIS